MDQLSKSTSEPSNRQVIHIDSFEFGSLQTEERLQALQKAQDGWYLLKQSYCTEDDFKKAIEDLNICCDDDKALQFLEDKEIQKLIIDKFKHFKRPYLNQYEIGCSLLHKLCLKSPMIKKKMVNIDNAMICLKLLKFDSHTERSLIAVLNVMSSLMSSVDVQRTLLQQENDIITSISKAMENYPHNANVQSTCIKNLLSLLSGDRASQKAFVRDHHIDHLTLTAVRNHANNGVVLKEGCQLLTLLDKLKSVHNHLLEEEIYCLIVEILSDKHASVTDSVWTCCMNLLRSLSEDETVQKFLVENDVHSSILTQLILCPDDVDLQVVGLRTFCHIAALVFENEEYNEGDDWLKKIWVAMRKFPENPHLQEICLKVLSNLLEFRPSLEKRIGDDPEKKQDPLHTFCLGALLINLNNAKVFTAACSAIYWICADNDRLQSQLMARHTHIAVLQGLGIHLSVSRAQAAGCMAIRGLVIFRPKWKSLVAKHEPLKALISALLQFPNNAGVQYQAIAAIACLADDAVIRHQCLVEQVHHKVFLAIKEHKDHAILQECCLEALSILASAEGGIDLIANSQAMMQTVLTMECHAFNAGIQKKGMILLQLFSSDEEFNNHKLLSLLALVTESTLRVFKDDIDILKETCVAMHLLAENRREFCQELVDMDVEKGLFDIMEHKQDDPDLLEYASYCIYVIGWVAGFKSKLLLSACDLGLLRVMQCLIELGADCNIGEGRDTPICYACENKNESMVQCILKQGINDVQTPLKLSLELQCHRITGMLLQYMGFDKQAGVVSWSGLNLCMIRPEWLVATLLDAPLVKESNVDGHLKPIMQRTQEGQQERTGLKISVNTQVQLGSRLPLRYPQDIVDQIVGESNHSKPLFDTKTKKSFLSRLHTKRSSADDVLNPISSPNLLRKRHSDSDIYKPEKITKKFIYVNWTNEIEKWKQQTVSGANIPYSTRDPRKKQATFRNSENAVPPETTWLRKSPMPASKNNQQRRPAVYEISCHNNVRKLSLPIQIDVLAEEDEADNRDAFTLPSDIYELDELFVDVRGCSEPDPDQDLDTSLEDTSPFKRERKYSSFTSTNMPETLVKKLQKNKVTLLDVSSNQIADLSSILVIGKTLFTMFESIEKLSLNHNSLSFIPDQIFKCLPMLQNLDLSFNNLQVFPAQSLACNRIKVIDLSHNHIEWVDHDNNLPVSFSLEELNMSYNKFSIFPSWVEEKVPSISILSLESNHIERLPEECCLKKLVKLTLSHNYLSKMPENFIVSKYLETFECAGNELVTLPSAKKAASFARLYSLKLANNSLREKEPFYIPKFILELPALRALDLSGNGLIGLPTPALWQSNNLRELLLSDNNIQKLDLIPNDRRWITLERLVIQRNNLQELPKEIGQLSGLTSLDISHNPAIVTLPDELGKLSKMWEFYFEGLKLDINEALLKGRTRDLIGYLHEKLKHSEEYYRIKMMVVGFGGRGKTSLLRTLQRPSCKKQLHEKSVATVGILVKDWKFLASMPARDNRDRDREKVWYTLSTWDFAGQEEFYSTHQCFLSNRALYLVVYDLSRGLSEVDTLKPWLVNIHARAPGCPVIVVATHKDAIPADQLEDRVNEIQHAIHVMTSKPGFPDIKEMAVVNATKDTREIHDLNLKIRRVINDFKLKGRYVMGQKIPASYKQLEECVSEQAKIRSFPVMRQHEINKLVRDAKIDLDKDELQQAVRFLHESGVLLHFEDAALDLKQLYFINPEWLCRMFAQVVTVREINPFINENGILHRDNVPQLFTGKKVGRDVSYAFPRDMIDRYLRLLSKFEIALPLYDKEFLIPCRVSPRRPSLKLPGSICRKNFIQRFYEMPFVPIGFWSRLICRFLSYIKEMMPELIGRKEQMTYWQEGIYLFKSEDNYVLVESEHENGENVVITVPASKQGSVILGHIVDHIDALIEEWYPGMLVKDPLTGEELLQKKVPCSSCKTEEVHSFSLEELINQADFDDVIQCPNHSAPVSLKLLTPDVMLWDLEKRFQLDPDQLMFFPNNESRIGVGSFGSVYRATYREKPVAVKVFNKVGDFSPHTTMRQEVTILRRLLHPSLIEMLAVGIRPRVIILELASLGSLGGVLKSGRSLSRRLMHRIAMQVAEGLMYLHKYKIIYRDLKPDNVLIFSLSLNVLINAKITDYGIARFAASYGFYASEGTPGYKAPEVAREETYTIQADVYSLAITMYTLVSGGYHPFEELMCRAELDAAVVEQRPIKSIKTKGQQPWPDVEDIIDLCLKEDPNKRLTSAQVYECLNCAEVLCLKRVIYISKDLTVECIAIRSHEDLVEAWFGSGGWGDSQLCWVNLADNNSEIKGMILPKPQRHGRIWCMTTVRQTAVLVGTQSADSGHIIVYDAWKHQQRHTLPVLDDAVISLLHFTSRDARDLIIAGLANGTIAVYDTSAVLWNIKAEPYIFQLHVAITIFLQSPGEHNFIHDGDPSKPVKCLLARGDTVYASYGSVIVVFDEINSQSKSIKCAWDTRDELLSERGNLIISMVLGHDLYITKLNSSIIEVWPVQLHSERQKQKKCSYIDMESIIRLNLKQKHSHTDTIVTSMMLQDMSTLWVGTRGGHIVLIVPATQNCIGIIHRHSSAIRSLVSIQTTGNRADVNVTKSLNKKGSRPELNKRQPNTTESTYNSFSVVLAGGLGYRGSFEGHATGSEYSNYGCITAWDADLKNYINILAEESRKRRNLVWRSHFGSTEKLPSNTSREHNFNSSL